MIKKLPATMALAAMVLGFLTLTALPASASTFPPIIHTVTAKCIDVKGGSKQVHAVIQQYHCNNTGAQDWEVLRATEGFQLFNPQSLMCLDVRSDIAQEPNGTTLQLYPCNFAAVWQLKDPFRGTGQLVHTTSGKCIDLEGGSTNDGATIQMWDCATNNTNQLRKTFGIDNPDFRAHTSAAKETR